MTSAIREVTRAHFGINTGLVPLLLVTGAWAVATVYAPVSYMVLSVWLVVSVGGMMGVGLRLHLTSHRAYLVPGLREANRIVSLSVLLLALLTVTAIGFSRLPLPSSLAVVWLCGLACFYAAGLSKNPIGVFFLAMLLGVLLPISVVRTQVRESLLQGISSLDVRGGAVLFLVAALFTILTWKRIGSVRGLSWIQTSTGEPTLFGFRSSVSSSLDSMASRLPAGLWGRARHFAFSTSAGSRQFYFLILLWSVIGVFFRLRSSNFYMLAFAIPLMLPVVGVGLPLTVSQRMFMLPMNRAEVLKYWGSSILLSFVKLWVAVALPYGILALTIRNDVAPPVALPFLFATSLVAQLPLFAVTMMARSRKTASGIPYTVFLLPFYLLLGMIGFLQSYPIPIGGIFLGSITLGPILIWLAYRRWCDTEVA